MAKRKHRQTTKAEEVPSSPSDDSGEVPSGSEPSDESNGSESEEEGPSSSSGDSDEDIVDIDFEFFDPKPTDFHGVKALLTTYLEDAVWDISGFVDLFLSQTTVGTVVKTSEDENPIGILTALNVARYKDYPCMKEVHRYLHKRITGKPEEAKLEDMWNKNPSDVGLVVSERLVNIPIDLVPPLYSSLLDEVMWATEDEPTKELQNYFKFKHYLILTRVFEELPKKSKDSNGTEALKKRKAASKDKKDLIFVKPEDELFLQFSTWSFTFPVNAETSAAAETQRLRQLRLVMAVEAKQMPILMDALKALVD